MAKEHKTNVLDILNKSLYNKPSTATLSIQVDIVRFHRYLLSKVYKFVQILAFTILNNTLYTYITDIHAYNVFVYII